MRNGMGIQFLLYMMATASQFGLSRNQLQNLMSQRGRGLLTEYNGVVGIAELLHTSVNTGLSDVPHDLEARKKEYGTDYVPIKQPSPIKSLLVVALVVILKTIWDKKLLILIATLALISTVLGATVEEQKDIAWIEGAAILTAVVLILVVTMICSCINERLIIKRCKLKEVDVSNDDPRFSVLRGGKTKELPLAELVVGDVAQFKCGDAFPVDGVLIQGYDVEVDESSLTGEAALIRKHTEGDLMLYAGTDVRKGRGTMLVTAVGPYTQQGMTLQLMKTQDDDVKTESTGCIAQVFRRVQEELEEESFNSSRTVLQQRVTILSIVISFAGSVAAAVCFLAFLLKFVIIEFGINRRLWDSSRDFSELLHFIIIGITVVVVAAPEGLPLAMHIVLSFFIKKMTVNGHTVRYLQTCETMGNATIIWSAKNGILTTNLFTVVESYFMGTKYKVMPHISDLPEILVDTLKTNIAVNSSYTSKLEMVGEDDRGSSLHVGNATECALLHFLVELGIDYEAIREEHPPASFIKVFTLGKCKTSSTVIPLPSGGQRLLTKGPSKGVLNRCSSILGGDGQVLPLSSDDIRDIMTTVITPMGAASLRTVCLAYKDFPASDGDGEIISSPDWDNEDSIVTDLTCIGIVGICDPIRPEVPQCVKQCQRAGITVCMMTGDNVETARAIAEECGIISKRDKFLVLEGKELNKNIRDNDGQVSQGKFDNLWPRLRVLAHCSPQDEYTVVDGIIQSHLHKNREVVVVAGIGTNDAPALKRADVGIAMGKSATDVAKEACDVIISNGSFSSVVKAVMWSRNVYDSISKFLQFQLTVNIVTISLLLISAFTINDSPLSVIQLLWVNLIMDTFASLALATEPPSEELLHRKSYKGNKFLISCCMCRFLIGHSLYQLTVLLVLLFAGPELFNIDDGKYQPLRAIPSQHFTFIFNTFVFMQIINEVNARKVHGERNVFKGIHRSWFFLVVVIGQVAVQVFLVQGPLGLVFRTTPLPLDLWIWSLLIASMELVVGQLLLLIPIHKMSKLWRKGGDEDLYPMPKEHQELVTDARYRWNKSISTVCTQIRVVNAFRSGLESKSVIHLSNHSQSLPSPGHPQLFLRLKKETAV